MTNTTKQALEQYRLPVSIKLSLLWASLMSLYIYNDYFSMFLPGAIEGMAAGRMGPLGEVTDLMLVAVSILLAVPALMIFLSAVLPPVFSRWLNIFMGVIYTIIEILTFFGSPLFYKIVVVLEVAVTTLIIWYAVSWPRQDNME